MIEVFGPAYAESYDLLYSDKDYGAECDLIELLFRAHGDGSVRRILDLGCGTGGHAIPLAEKGYEVVGVDRSGDMLAVARRKITREPGRIEVDFLQGDIRSLDLQRHFDAVLMMFAVLSYQLRNEDVVSALRTARRHLRRDGLLILDFWYGPAVLHQRPSPRFKVVQIPGGRILRSSSGKLDVRRRLCVVDLHVWKLDAKGSVVETQERHRMRFFFPHEVELFFQNAEFEPVQLGAFPEHDQEPDETTWNALYVARAIGDRPDRTSSHQDHPTLPSQQ